jgi:hypothetical protein
MICPDSARSRGASGSLRSETSDGRKIFIMAELKVVTPDEKWTPAECDAFAKEALDHGWDLHKKMFDLLMTEQRPEIALNIAMNLVAHVIVANAQSRKAAELGAKRAVAKLLMPMVRMRWMPTQPFSAYKREEKAKRWLDEIALGADVVRPPKR